MQLALEVHSDSQAAFFDPVGEAQRFLKEVAASIAKGDFGGPLLDSGGGTIGYWRFNTIDEEQDSL